MKEYRLLIAEDERIVARDLKGSLEGMGYEVIEIVSSGEEAIESVASVRPDLVLMDIVLKGEMDGVDASREIKDRYDIPVVYLTAHTDPGTIERVKQTEPYGYIVKPFRMGELRSVIEIAIHKHDRGKRFKEESENIASVLGVVGSGVVTIDREGGIRYMNPRAEEITGRERSVLTGKSVNGLVEIVSGSEGDLEDMIMFAIEGESGNGRYEEVGINVDGEEKRVDIHVMRLDGDEGEVKGAALLIMESGVGYEYGSGGMLTGYGKSGGVGKVKLAVAGSPLVTEGVRVVLKGVEGVEIVGEITQEDKVLEVVRDSGAEVLFMDSVMIGKSLDGVLEGIRGMEEDVKTVLLVHDVDESYIKRCIGKGVCGFLGDDYKHKIVNSLYTVIKDGFWMENEMFAKIIGVNKYGLINGLAAGIKFTKKEREVLELALRGYSNKHISKTLYISENTVKTHMKKIFRKTGIKKRSDLILLG